MNVFLHLQGLIGGVRDDEIGGKNMFQLCKFVIDPLTEARDLLQALAKESPNPRIAQAATAALQRLEVQGKTK